MSTYLIWFLAGVFFLYGESILPGFILFFFSLGALIVSLVTFSFNLSINSQIILFALSSVISLLIFRNYLKNIFKGTEEKNKDFDDSIKPQLETATVSRAIGANSLGEIKYKGTFYKAQSDRPIEEGEIVKVLKKGDKQGSFYLVEEL